MSVNNFGVLVREVYAISSLSIEDQKKYYLIIRYKNKVSQRLLQCAKDLRKEGEEELSRLMRELVYMKSPVIDMLPKTDPFKGHYLPVPIKVRN